MRTLCLIYSLFFGLLLLDDPTGAAPTADIAPLADSDPHTLDWTP